MWFGNWPGLPDCFDENNEIMPNASMSYENCCVLAETKPDQDPTDKHQRFHHFFYVFVVPNIFLYCQIGREKSYKISALGFPPREDVYGGCSTPLWIDFLSQHKQSHGKTNIFFTKTHKFRVQSFKHLILCNY